MPDLDPLDELLGGLAEAASRSAAPLPAAEVRRRGQARRTRRAVLSATASVVAVTAVGGLAWSSLARVPGEEPERQLADSALVTEQQLPTRLLAAGRRWQPAPPDGQFSCGALRSGGRGTAAQTQFEDGAGALARQAVFRGAEARAQYRAALEQLARCHAADGARVTATRVGRVDRADEGVVYAYRFADRPPATVAVARVDDAVVLLELSDDRPVPVALAAAVVEDALDDGTSAPTTPPVTTTTPAPSPSTSVGTSPTPVGSPSPSGSPATPSPTGATPTPSPTQPSPTPTSSEEPVPRPAPADPLPAHPLPADPVPSDSVPVAPVPVAPVPGESVPAEEAPPAEPDAEEPPVSPAPPAEATEQAVAPAS